MKEIKIPRLRFIRVGFGDDDRREILALMREYGISARLTAVLRFI